jgi:hypothetical protein
MQQVGSMSQIDGIYAFHTPVPKCVNTYPPTTHIKRNF